MRFGETTRNAAEKRVSCLFAASLSPDQAFHHHGHHERLVGARGELGRPALLNASG